jgi:hypothetical protein
MDCDRSRNRVREGDLSDLLYRLATQRNAKYAATQLPANLPTTPKAQGEPGTGLMLSNAKMHGPDDINWTVGFASALAVSPTDASAEEAPGLGDLKTARLWEDASLNTA